MRRAQQWQVWTVVTALMAWMPSGWAEVIDVSRTVTASGSVGSVATFTVTPRNISDNTTASGIAFGTVVVGATPWVRAPQYLRIQYQSNQASWAVRILTNNRSSFPGMAGRITNDNGTPGNPADDQLNYAGMIGSTPADPNNRVSLGWQVYKDNVVGGPAAPPDTDVGGLWNSPWAFVADASDCLSACTSGAPVTIDKTGEYFRIVQGNASTSGLLAHPNDGNRVGDNDVSLYVVGRFGGAPADSYNTTVILELYHF